MNNSFNVASQVGYIMKQIYPPVLMAIGIPGNILSIIILLKLRSTQRSIYLVCLACADLLVLCVSVLPDWIGGILTFHLRDVYSIVCRLQTFGMYSSIQFSSWILVLVTTERVVSVIYPHRVRIVFSLQRTLISVILTIVGILSLNVHFIIGLPRDNITENLTENHTDSHCFVREYVNTFYVNVWPWVDLLISFLLPCVFLLTGNIIIIYRLRRNSRKDVYTCRVAVVTQALAIEARRGQASVVTKRVIVLNVIYIICMLPACLFAVVMPYWFSDSYSSENGVSDLLAAIVTMLMFVNSSVNFLLYIFLGERFRKELFSMITCGYSDVFKG